MILQAEQQKNYYHIDRKLASNEPNQCLQGINELIKFIPNIIRPDIFNSLLLRLGQLLLTSRTFYLKSKIAIIMTTFQKQINCLLISKDQLNSILVKCLKGMDQFTHIIALKIISGLGLFFEKDIAMYHLLLSRICIKTKIINEHQTTNKQNKQVILTIAKILNKSQLLSTLFARRIDQILNIKSVKIISIFYICSKAKFHYKQHQLVIKIMQKNFQNYKQKIQQNQQIYNNNKNNISLHKIQQYFCQTIIKMCNNNYKIIEFYWKYLSILLSQLQYQILLIQKCLYSFLNIPINILQIQYSQNNIQQFLDKLYSIKLYGLIFQNYCIVDYIVSQKLLNCSQLSSQELLLTYYCKQSYDDKIIPLIQHNSSLKWLKICLVTANFTSARVIIRNILNQPINLNYLPTILIFINFYASLHEKSLQLNNRIKIINYMKNFAQFLPKQNEKMKLLLKIWVIFEKYFQQNQFKQDNIKDIKIQLEKIKIINGKSMSLQQKSFEKQFNLAYRLLIQINQHKEEKYIVKQQSNVWIPQHLIKSQLWFAYLSKSTIMSLF